MVVKDKSAIINRIEKAAAQLVFSYGAKGWNMDDCAKNAGITKRTLYQYIESKEKLIEQVLTGFIRTTQQDLAAELADSPDFTSGINRMLLVFPKMIIKMESAVIQNIFLNYPDIEKLVIRERLNLAEESLKYIRKGQREGFIKEGIEAETILEILQSLVIYYLKNNPEDFEGKLRTSFTTVLNGILNN